MPLRTKQACLVDYGSEAHLTLNTVGEVCTSKTNNNDSLALNGATQSMMLTTAPSASGFQKAMYQEKMAKKFIEKA